MVGLLYSILGIEIEMMETIPNITDYDEIEDAINSFLSDPDIGCELVVRFHLKNNEVIDIHSNTFDSVTYGYDFSDVIHTHSINVIGVQCDTDRIPNLPTLELGYKEIGNSTDVTRWVVLPLSNVNYIEKFTIDVDFPKLWKELAPSEREKRKWSYRSGVRYARERYDKQYNNK